MIRNATHADVEAMTEMVMRAKRKSVYVTVPPSKERARKTIRQCISGPSAYAKVAEHGGEVVAMLLGVKDQMFFAERSEAKDIVFLCENARYAKALRDDFCQWAWADHRVANILLSQSSGIEVERTSKWFQKGGFQIVGGVFYMNRWDVEGQKVAI